jgi:hypothetical protein
MKQKVYRADCVECGDSFHFFFKTSEQNKDRLSEMGKEIASRWGSHCTQVIEVTNGLPSDFDLSVWDADKKKGLK